MKELANVTARQLEVRLEKYTKEIKASYRQAHEAALLTVKYALICGRNLNEAKRHCVHGSFQRYVVDTCGCHPNTARKYMQVADHYPDLSEKLGEDCVEKMGLNELLEFIKKNYRSPKRLDPPESQKSNTRVCVLPPSGGEEEPEEPTDLFSDEDRVYDVSGHDRGEADQAADCPSARPHSGLPERDRQTLEAEGDDPAEAPEGDPLRGTAYDLCMQAQRAIDALQRVLDRLNAAYPNTDLYARICGREDENSHDLARWSRSAE